MLTAAYFILKRGLRYADLGPDYFDRTDRVRTANRLVRKLSELGFEVKIHQAA
jgi:transposase